MLTDQKKMQNPCDTILRDNEILKLRVDTYEREIEDLRQCSRGNCILIHRIPEEREEITDELALDIFNNKVGLDVDLSELDRTHRLGPWPVADDDDTGSQKKNERKIRPIIVKFLSYRGKSKVIKAGRIWKAEKYPSPRPSSKVGGICWEKLKKGWGSGMPGPMTAKSLPKETTAFMTFQLNFKLCICKRAVIALRQWSQVQKKFVQLNCNSNECIVIVLWKA